MPSLSEQRQEAYLGMLLGVMVLRKVYDDWANCVLRYYWLTKELENSTHA